MEFYNLKKNSLNAVIEKLWVGANKNTIGLNNT